MTYPIFVMSCGHQLERENIKRSRYNPETKRVQSGCFCKSCAVSHLEYKIFQCERCGTEFEASKKCNHVKYCPVCGPLVQKSQERIWCQKNRTGHDQRDLIPPKERPDFQEPTEYPAGHYGVMIPELWTLKDVIELRGYHSK